MQLPETVCDEQQVRIQIIYFPDDQNMWTAVTAVGVINILAMLVLIVFRLMNRNRTNLSESGESCTMDGTFFKFLLIYLAQGSFVRACVRSFVRSFGGSVSRSWCTPPSKQATTTLAEHDDQLLGKK